MVSNSQNKNIFVYMIHGYDDYLNRVFKLEGSRTSQNIPSTAINTEFLIFIFICALKA